MLINEPYTHAHLSYTMHALSRTTFAPLPLLRTHTHTHTHTHTLYRSPGSRLATQCYNMEALTSCEEEVLEEESEAELDHLSTGMVGSLKL